MYSDQSSAKTAKVDARPIWKMYDLPFEAVCLLALALVLKSRMQNWSWNGNRYKNWNVYVVKVPETCIPVVTK